MDQLTYGAITAAAGRISGRIRPVALAPVEPGMLSAGHSKQHAGSFKPRVAVEYGSTASMAALVAPPTPYIAPSGAL